MFTIGLNIKNEKVLKEIFNLLEKLKDEVEILSQEDLNDLILLKKTRNEESIPFEEFLKNENKH